MSKRKKWVNPADKLPPEMRKELVEWKKQQIADRKRAFLAARRGNMGA